MNCNDYDQFILQKCRLAVAIAVLRTKPKELSIEEYLNRLKAKIIDTDSGDDITICEDDFNFDESDTSTNLDDNSNDSVTILKNFDFNNLDAVAKPAMNNSFLNVMEVLNNIDDAPNDETNINDSQTYFDGMQNTQDITYIDENNLTLSEKQNNENNKENPQTPNNLLNIDSQLTEVYDLQDFTEFNTHYSQSQDNFIISKNLLLNNHKDVKGIANNATHSKEIYGNNILEVNNIKETHNTIIIDKDIVIDKVQKGISKENSNTINSINDKRKTTLLCDEKQNKRTKMDSKTSQNSSNDAFLTQFSSQSNNNTSFNLTFDSSLNLDSLNTINNINSNKFNNSQSSFNFDSLNAKNNINIKNIDNNQNIITTFDNDNFDNQENAINIRKSKDITQKSNSYSLDEFEYHTQSFNFTNSTFDKSKNVDNIKEATFDKNDNENATFGNIITIDDNSKSSEDITDLTNSQVEIVTFKVLEELSKVKSYLNRKERVNKSDSGYRSYQRRYSSDSASQCSGVWINESAHCLVNFITTSPLVENTADITDEISKVLGKLIDKLHEDEMYPNFLEKLLETVENLLTTVYEGRNYGESILHKDETIQRIYLLNRSSHIVKYSIEKITNIVENTLQNLNNLELENTDKSENLCYIFYILEDLLKRHNKYKILSSQSSSQISQEEKILKKSSLTEVWRKKWNLTKSEISEGSSEKICSLSKCRDVLNKLIVQAMEGYSLVSFAALQCFNLLQN